ncbi:PcfJ domain-containing protein [Desulfobacterales bacterium HSG16]|nr:PcfJ domain-containing protein [Desulfobacterales bacterium HSG16]
MTCSIKISNNRITNYNNHKHFARQRLDKAVHRIYADFGENTGCRDMFLQLLLHIQQHTNLLKTSPDHGRIWPSVCEYITGLGNLALHHDDFIRPVQKWHPSDNRGRKIFASLAHHLLAEYKKPFFMNSVWLRDKNENAAHRNWYIQMSRGASIRKLDIPILMTRKMEHLFLKAPDHFTVEEAMRHSQVTGLGGNEDLVQAILATRLGKNLENDDFWRTVIHFFINNAAEIETCHVNPIIDYLHNAKFAKREVHTDNGVNFFAPPKPDFSMKGRSFVSIMRLVDGWHEELAVAQSNSNFKWRKSKLNGFSYLEETNTPEYPHRVWTIAELLSGKDLASEGKIMRHCVHSYASGCFNGRTTIWSLKREINGTRKRMVTIEVDPTTRTIRQARGKCNRVPDKKSSEIMMKWAKKEGLKQGT